MTIKTRTQSYMGQPNSRCFIAILHCKRHVYIQNPLERCVESTSAECAYEMTPKESDFRNTLCV